MTRMDGCWLTRMDGRRRVGSRRPGGGGLFWLTRMNECWLTRMDGRRRAGSRRWWSTAASTSPSARRRRPAPLRHPLRQGLSPSCFWLSAGPPTPPRPAQPRPAPLFCCQRQSLRKTGRRPAPPSIQYSARPPPPRRRPAPLHPMLSEGWAQDPTRPSKPRRPSLFASADPSAGRRHTPRLPLPPSPPEAPSYPPFLSSSPPSSLHKKRHGSGAGVGGCG